MSRLLLCWPNRVDAGTISGGSWESDLSLTNLQDRQQWKVARSTDATLASTQFDIDFGSAISLRAFALANHNMSQAATWRITCGTSSGASDLLDTSFQNVWHLSFDADLMVWGDVSLWEGIVDTDYVNHPYLAIHSLPSWINARYMRIEINDTTNAAGYVDIGRLFAGGGFEPTYNAAYGLQDGWDDKTEIIEMEAGNEDANLKRRYRYVKFGLQWISHTEAEVVHEMQRRLGVFGEVLYVPNPGNQNSSQRYGILGRMKELSPIDYPYYGNRSVGFQIKEL